VNSFIFLLSFAQNGVIHPKYRQFAHFIVSDILFKKVILIFRRFFAARKTTATRCGEDKKQIQT